MAGPPVPPAVTPRPPGQEEEPAREHGRLRTWIAIVGLVALLAAGAAGYAISEIESTKDENREDDAAVSALREDFETYREDTSERLDTLEGQLDDAASDQEQEKLRQDLTAVEKRVDKLDQQDDGGESDEITTRVDDLEQRIEDLENDSN